MAATVLSILLANPAPPSDAKLVDLGDGFVRVEAPTYSIEVPKGWRVGRETPWGQRDAKPVGGEGKLGVMTAPPSRQSWDSLYRTSLYFILRERPGKATPYKVTKREDGLEACTFSIIDDTGFAARRYVLLKHPEKGLLALSVQIPGRDAEAAWEKNFQRMVSTARFR
ncbi:MAG: hypothetical protein MH204_10460 [Fimbriimonadaceae bacterium]|nr:hypothetical protein [Fimbriimonadaceae bacterium]